MKVSESIYDRVCNHVVSSYSISFYTVSSKKGEEAKRFSSCRWAATSTYPHLLYIAGVKLAKVFEREILRSDYFPALTIFISLHEYPFLG